jgi:hypothetical protein
VILPLALFILPAMFIVVLGPALLKLPQLSMTVEKG